MSKRFLFFENFKSIADKLPDDMRLKFYDALLAYVFDGIEPDDVMIAALITAIKPSLDKEDIRGGSRVGAGAPKGNQNAIKNNQYNQKQSIQSNQSKTIKDNQNNQSFLETETEDLNNTPPKNKFSDENIILSPYKGNAKCSSDCERKAKFEINGQKFCGQHARIELSKLGRLDLIPAEKFIKPTFEEVQAYCQERNNSVDVARWFDYYTANGWKVGKNAMKDWRAAVRTWERSSAAAPVSLKTGSARPSDEELAAWEWKPDNPETETDWEFWRKMNEREASHV